MKAHTRQCRIPLLAPVVSQLTTQSGLAGKGSEYARWRYVACAMVLVMLPSYT